jgi:antitoxin YefM
MTTIPLTEAKARLNELVDEAVTLHEHVTITRRGRPAAMLVSVEEWESLQETLFWQSVPGIHEDIAEARRERAEGRTYDEAQVRSALGLRPRE